MKSNAFAWNYANMITGSLKEAHKDVMQAIKTFPENPATLYDLYDTFNPHAPFDTAYPLKRKLDSYDAIDRHAREAFMHMEKEPFLLAYNPERHNKITLQLEYLKWQNWTVEVEDDDPRWSSQEEKFGTYKEARDCFNYLAEGIVNDLPPLEEAIALLQKFPGGEIGGPWEYGAGGGPNEKTKKSYQIYRGLGLQVQVLVPRHGPDETLDMWYL